jgi:hypothetical protein
MLLHLFGFISSCINSLFLSEIPFSNKQMVNTRSGGGQHIPPVVRAHIANQQNQAPPPPLNPTMDPVRNSSLPLNAANPKPYYHYSKHLSSAKSVTTGSTTSTGGQA